MAQDVGKANPFPDRTLGDRANMTKRKLTAAEKAAKKKRRLEFMTIFINGKQKRVKRPPTIDGILSDEFVGRNADALWFYQNEEWENLYLLEQAQQDDDMF